jgi:hypothetical protein
MLRPRVWTFLAPAVLAFALAAPAVAAADTTGSDNWSGYAVHANRTTFKQVAATWQQPGGNCSAGGPTYSAFWVGLGGYSTTARAIEQLGTELDCSAKGAVQLSAWYELLPAPVRKISMTIEPGDTITGNVSVVRKNVTLTLTDTTRGETFSRTVLDHTIDQTSADWITEAPSQCAGAYNCEPLPLTPFGSVTFSGASAETVAGRSGAISSPLWHTTKIVLARAARFVSTRSPTMASPSALHDGGSSFTVSYSGANTGSPNSAGAPPAGSAGGQPTTSPGNSSGGGNPGGGGWNPGGGGWNPGGGGWNPGGGG